MADDRTHDFILLKQTDLLLSKGGYNLGVTRPITRTVVQRTALFDISSSFSLGGADSFWLNLRLLRFESLSAAGLCLALLVLLL